MQIVGGSRLVQVALMNTLRSLAELNTSASHLTSLRRVDIQSQIDHRHHHQSASQTIIMPPAAAAVSIAGSTK